MIAISVPCPFCNANAGFRLETEKVGQQEEEQQIMWVGCTNCGAGGPNANSPEEAMLLWNQRVMDLSDDLHEMAQWESALKGGLVTGTARDVIRRRAEAVLRRVGDGPGESAGGRNPEVREIDGAQDPGREHVDAEGHGPS